jgi:heparan-alpha-glucosaminide N-acetyltransferase
VKDRYGQMIDGALFNYDYQHYYVIISFISNTVTTLSGAWVGMSLRTQRPLMDTLRILPMSVMAAFVGGLALSLLIPGVKRLWTASWTLYSPGWILVMTLGFILLIEMAGWQKVAFPLIVVGMNSIFFYSAGFLIKGSISRAVTAISSGFRFISPLAPVAQACGVMLVLWYVCPWLYRQRILINV